MRDIMKLKTLVLIGILVYAGYGSNLSELLAVSKGDMASIQLNQYAHANWQVSLVQFDVYLYSFFDRTDSTIAIEIYGMKEKADDAQKAIEHFRMLLKNDFIPFFKNNYRIEIDEIYDIKFFYRNRAEEGRRIIYIWEKGKFRYPIK